MTRRWLLPAIPVLCYGWHIRKVLEEYREKRPPTTLSKYVLLRSLPLRSMSALTGAVSELLIPSPFRRPIYGLYAWLFGCRLQECSDLKTFPTFQSFFARHLKEGARTTSFDCVLSSPCDGKIVEQGCVELSLSDNPHQFDAIKQVYYTVPDLIGSAAYKLLSEHVSRQSWLSLFGLQRPTKYLHYTTVYLAPGDYHRFHAPTDMRITKTDHITGEKAPVAPLFTKLVPDVLQVNQRAIVMGNDSTGALVCLVPVGSLNVGCLDVTATTGSSIARGSDIGCFKMGSTIVLLYLTDCKDMRWTVPLNSRILTGQPLLHSA